MVYVERRSRKVGTSKEVNHKEEAIKVEKKGSFEVVRKI
jgi:hypothetical protein